MDNFEKVVDNIVEIVDKFDGVSWLWISLWISKKVVDNIVDKFVRVVEKIENLVVDKW